MKNEKVQFVITLFIVVLISLVFYFLYYQYTGSLIVSALLSLLFFACNLHMIIKTNISSRQKLLSKNLAKKAYLQLHEKLSKDQDLCFFIEKSISPFGLRVFIVEQVSNQKTTEVIFNEISSWLEVTEFWGIIEFIQVVSVPDYSQIGRYSLELNQKTGFDTWKK